MSTLEFVSTSADGLAETGAHLVTAAALISGLGSQPALTVPLVCGRPPAVALIWQRLAAVADFYGTDIPGTTALGTALHGVLGQARDGAVLAVDIVVVPVHGRTQFVVSGTTIEPHRREPVLLTVEQVRPVPQWLRMAADTTSRAADDLDARVLAAAGYRDTVAIDGDLLGRPQRGALIFDTGHGRVGTGAQHLDLLCAAGLFDELPRADEPVEVPVGAAAWWISPLFERHPVAAIGARRFEVGR